MENAKKQAYDSCHYLSIILQNFVHQHAVYKDGWKYVYRYDLNKEYLYNIHNDISELDNKVETETNRRNKLRKLLDRYLKEVKAKYPKENNNYKEYKL